MMVRDGYPRLHLVNQVWPVSAVALTSLLLAYLVAVAPAFPGLGGGNFHSFPMIWLPVFEEAHPIPADLDAVAVTIKSDGKVFVGWHWVPRQELKTVLGEELARAPEADSRSLWPCSERVREGLDRPACAVRRA